MADPHFEANVGRLYRYYKVEPKIGQWCPTFFIHSSTFDSSSPELTRFNFEVAYVPDTYDLDALLQHHQRPDKILLLHATDSRYAVQMTTGGISVTFGGELSDLGRGWYLTLQAKAALQHATYKPQKSGFGIERPCIMVFRVDPKVIFNVDTASTYSCLDLRSRDSDTVNKWVTLVTSFKHRCARIGMLYPYSSIVGPFCKNANRCSKDMRILAEQNEEATQIVVRTPQLAGVVRAGLVGIVVLADR